MTLSTSRSSGATRMRRGATERSRHSRPALRKRGANRRRGQNPKGRVRTGDEQHPDHVGCRPGPCCQRHHNGMTAGRGRVAGMRVRRVAGAPSHDTGSRKQQLSCGCAVLLGGAGKGTAACPVACTLRRAFLNGSRIPAAGIVPSLTPFPCPFNLGLSAATKAAISCRRSCLRCVRAVSLGWEGRGTHAVAWQARWCWRGSAGPATLSPVRLPKHYAA